MTDLRDPSHDRLRAALASGPPLRLAVLFGSRATGRARAGSDFDIGIVPVDPELSLNEELLLASALSAAVSAEVDVVRLDDDGPLLGAEVVRAGICLLEIHPDRGTATSRRRLTSLERGALFDREGRQEPRVAPCSPLKMSTPREATLALFSAPILRS